MQNFLSKWSEEVEALREIMVACGLTEEIKWRSPCFMLNDRNIAIIQPFKETCSLMYFKGSLLKDPKSVLVNPGANSQAQRRFDFTTIGQITKLKATIKAYTKEAIALEESGKKIEFKKEITIPEELQKRLKKNAAFKKAFEALTPGRQRGYCLFISTAKQTQTREARIDKCAPKILKGQGLNDF